MDKLLSFVDGKKTYIGAIGFVLLALYSYKSGDPTKASEYLLLALSLVGLRHAVNKTVEPEEKK